MSECAQCRLCDAKADHVFVLPVLGKYDVSYFKCRQCGSLQTESPYWLQEAYGDDVHPEDKGYLTRNLLVYRNVRFILRQVGVSRNVTILDFGGGLGFVARLLREDGLNAFSFDTYTKAPFPDVAWDGSKPDVILAIELFEHLPNPKAELGNIFGPGPDYVYVRTWRYSGQGKEWSYIGASHGEHVFFYTDEAMRKIASSYGYGVLFPTGGDALFHRKPLSPITRQIVLRGLRHRRLRMAVDISQIIFGDRW